MALAYLKYRKTAGDQYCFDADIGSNLHYQYKIGKRRRRFRGLWIIDEVVHTSQQSQVSQGILAPFRTEFMLKIPKSLFRDRARYIQLYSAKDRAGGGMTMSTIVSIMPSALSLSTPSQANYISEANSVSMEHTAIKNKSFSYREPELSESMFIGAIMGALPGLLSAAGPVISKVVGGIAGGGGGGILSSLLGGLGGSGGGGILSNLLGSLGKGGVGDIVSNLLGALGGDGDGKGGEDVSKMIGSIVDLLGRQGAAGQPAQAKSLEAVEATAPIDPKILIRLSPFLTKIITPESVHEIGDDPMKMLVAISNAVRKMSQKELEEMWQAHNQAPRGLSLSMGKKHGSPTYSKAQIAPALLAALPALAPLVGKLLDPKVIGAIGDQPLKVIDSFKDMFMGFDQETMKTLERLHPKDTTAMLPLLMKMSMSLSENTGGKIRYQYDPKVDLEFVEVKMVELQGKKKSLYSKGAPLYFPIRVYTKAANPPARTIPKVILKLCIQDPDTLKILLEKRFHAKHVNLGDTLRQIVLQPEATDVLPLGKPLRVEVSLIWQHPKDGRSIGTFKTHYFNLVGSYVFDSLREQIGPPVPLNDIVQHRSFWHKVWEGGFTDSRRWEIDFDVKYFYVLDLKEDAPSKMETKRKKMRDNAEERRELPSRRKVRSKMKSGMELTLDMLNQALPDLGQTSLDERQLEALEVEALQPYYNQSARMHLEFRGRGGDTATLWTYPEMSLHNLQLMKMESVNELGQVTAISPQQVVFPRPSHIHFIGTKSE